MKIDFVVTWLDTKDPDWKAEYQKYRGDIVHKEDESRYRNWDFFKYWFRAVENYAPWVNKVFLVTNGKYPDWINSDHPKLVLVKHSDYMPDKYLPTFNSRAIELNFYRIEGLSEHFVYFNDDMFINTPVKPEYYFKKGLPCDSNEETFFYDPYWDPQNKFSTKISIYCDIAILNYHFSRRKVVNSSKKRWYGPHLSLLGLFTSIMISIIQRRSTQRFQFFRWRHYEQPMLKSIIQEIWDIEGDMADRSCTRFRQEVSFNPYIIRYWQFAKNKFCPMRLNNGKLYTLGKHDLNMIVKALSSNKYHSICLNDTPYCSDEYYENSRKTIAEVFDRKFPKKSLFEK